MQCYLKTENIRLYMCTKWAPSVPQERVALFFVGFCGKHTLKVLIILSFIVFFTMQFIPNGGFDKKLE